MKEENLPDEVLYHTEEKLRDSELALETATAQLGVWYVIYDWKQDIGYLGKRAQEMTGLSYVVPDFINRWLSLAIIDEEDVPEFLNAIAAVKDGKSQSQAECGIHLMNEAHWVRFMFTQIVEQDGTTTKVIGTGQIIDDIRKLEEKYEIERRRGMLSDDTIIAHSIFNLSTNTPIEMNMEHLIIPEVSITDLKEIAVIESTLIIEPEDKRTFINLHDRVSLLRRFEDGENEIALELRCQLPNGRICWIRNMLHILRQPRGNDVLLFEYTYDINKAKSIDIMMDFAVNDEYDLIGSVNFADNGAVMLYGKESYNFFGESVVEENYDVSLNRFARNAIVPEERKEYLEKANITNIKNILKDKNAYEFYFHMLKDGKRKTKRVRYILYGKQRDVCLFIQNDITELLEEERKKQNELKDALSSAERANHYKSTFLSQMSHEIRTPMNAIIGMARLAEDTKDIHEKDSYIKKIESSSDFLLGIINDILDMSRIENGKFELHPVWHPGYEILISCIDMLQPEMDKKGITFEYPKMNCEIGVEYYVDVLRVKQIYMNLLNNAIKFTPQGGHIRLSIKNVRHDATSSVDQITIADTGCGMSQEFLTRIFRPFEQEQNPYSSLIQGTGLGLALVKQILTAMGGDIQVESELGKGSVFTFTISYEYRFSKKKEDSQRMEKKVELKGKKVLLVEDHPLNREIATKLLEKKGMIVETAEDGAVLVNLFCNTLFDKYLIKSNLHWC